LPFVFFAYPLLLGLCLVLAMEVLKAVRARVPFIDTVLGW
jgi:hypothetical protein